jgi:cation:H+ antiporter
MLIALISFAVGLYFVVKGADWLVDGSSAVAKKFKVSDLVIGLTIVAFGTSAPELVINIVSSLKGATDIAIGNVLGSNIFNIAFILGLCALIAPLKVTRGTVWKEIPLSLLAAVLVGIFSADIFLDGHTFSEISRIDGIALLAFFVIFLYYTFGIAKVSGEKVNEEVGAPVVSGKKSFALILAGLLGLVLGGRAVVYGAVEIAEFWGLSEALIGLTIVAIGTSLPELATSIAAVRKNNVDIAVGNVVGSNIFNIFFILGTSATIKSLPFSVGSIVDVWVTIITSLLLFAFMFIGKRHVLERYQGGIFILFYILYIVYLVNRG